MSLVDVYGGGGPSTSSVYNLPSDRGGSQSVDPTTTAAPLVPPVICDDSAKIEELLALIDSLYATIDKLFPLIRLVAKQHSQLAVTGILKPSMYIRLLWIEQHKGVRFTGSLVQLLQIKDNYLALGEDWTQDKLLVTRLPPAYQ